MRQAMRSWSRRQKKRQEEQIIRRESGIRRLMEQQYSSMSTAFVTGFPSSAVAFSTSTFYTRNADNDVRMLPDDRGRAATQQVSTRPTLEPILTDPPPLRPVRQFE
jgi:hypothetical protein